VRRQGAGAEDAEDLTQGFFRFIAGGKDLNSVRKEKRRLRSYLLASVKHFWLTSRVMPWRSSAAKASA